MPKDLNAPVWHTMRTLHRGEVPRTRFEDIEDAKRVTVLKYPSMTDDAQAELEAYHGGEGKYKELEAHLSFARTCHALEPLGLQEGDSWAMLGANDTLTKTLGNLPRTLTYVLRLEGLTRVLSHQLVRAQVGWDFSEACTGDHDWRHATFLIPRPWMRNPELLEAHVEQMLRSKLLYCADIDGVLRILPDYVDGVGKPARGIPVESTTVHMSSTFDEGTPLDARYGLHPNLKTYVQAHVNLLALSVWYAARSCTMTQAWEMVVLAERVKEAVIAATPWAACMFKRPCDQGRCWYMGAKDVKLAMANYYVPDELHDKFPWHPQSFLYGRTPYEMNSGPVAFEAREYHGMERVK